MIPQKAFAILLASFLRTGLGNTPFSFGGALVGLIVTSHDQAVLNTSRFDNVSVTPVNLPPDWLDSDVGNVGIPGSAAAFNSLVWTVKGAGDDIWGQADAFHFAFKEVRANVEVTARVNSELDTDDFAKAGVMLRDLTAGDTPPAADEATVILDVRPNGEIEFMMRSTRGGEMQFLNGMHVQFPVSLRLERVSGTVLGSVSTDGTTWQQIGTVPTPFTGDLIGAGLAVTSHNQQALNNGSFQDVLAIERQP